MTTASYSGAVPCCGLYYLCRPAGICTDQITGGPTPEAWYQIVCTADRIPDGQGRYASESAAQDVMRLHGGACPGEHRIEPYTPPRQDA